MNPQKKYRLKRRYETPCRSYNVGVIDTVEEWMRVFPEMTPDLFDIKDDWFEPVDDEIRVTVGACAEINRTTYNTVIQTSVPITSELSPKITSAIENVLNDNRPCAFDEKKLQERYEELLKNPLLYTQADLDKAREDAFYAARINQDNHVGTIRFHDDGTGMYYYHKKYTTFQDYLKSIGGK